MAAASCIGSSLPVTKGGIFATGRHRPAIAVAGGVRAWSGSRSGCTRTGARASGSRRCSTASAPSTRTWSIFESHDWGRVLALDGVVQTTTGDEFCYHEMIVHVPILAHGSAREVLIIGGGDGGCLREALKHAGRRAGHPGRDRRAA